MLELLASHQRKENNNKIISSYTRIYESIKVLRVKRKQERQINSTQIRKEKIKLSIFADDVITI